MIVEINIPQPVLIAGEYFRIRYRKVGVFAWTNAPNQSNAQFTLDLPAGDYELEAVLIRADGTECPAVIVDFSVIELEEENPCITATASLLAAGRGYEIEIIYTVPTPAPCGYSVNIAPTGGIAPSQTYTNLPPSPWRIPVVNGDYTVRIDMILCNGNVVPCFYEELEAADNPCIGAVLVSAQIFTDGISDFLRLTITQSSPATSPFQVFYSQIGVLLSGVPDGGGPVPLSAPGNPAILVLQLSPNYNVAPINGVTEIRYQGSFTDACGNSMKWEAARALT